MMRYILRGAANGLVIWMTFMVAEEAICSLVPMLRGSMLYVPDWRWPSMILLAVGYAVLGLFTGALTGAVFSVVRRKHRPDTSGDPGRLLQGIALLVVLCAYAIHMITDPDSSGPLVAAACVPWTIALIAAIASGFRFRWMVFISQPWVIAFILPATVSVVIFAILERNILRLVLYVALILAGACAIGAISRRWLRPSPGSALPVRQGVSVLLLGIGLVVAILALERDVECRRPPVSPRGSTPPPNLLLLSLDTVRADHTSLYGYERNTTPNLVSLSETATVYRQAVASSNQTLSTHASIFTGLYSRSHGAYPSPDLNPIGMPLAEHFHTLAEFLADRGYWNLGAVANFGYLNPGLGLAQGFHYYDARIPLAPFRDLGSSYLRVGIRRLMQKWVSTAKMDRQTRTAEEITDHAIALLEKARGADSPFFLFVNYMDTHNPYLPPPPYDTLFPGKDPSFTDERRRRLRFLHVEPGMQLTANDRDHMISQYDGAIAYIDSQIARLLARLEETSTYDNTMIVVVGDHGEAFGEHSVVGHGRTLYQHQIFVPLLVRQPGQKTGRACEAIVSQVDILPTILDAIGTAIPDSLHGRSLSNLQGPDFAVSESFPSPVVPHSQDWHRALVSDHWKLIVGPSGEMELYDLASDRIEQENLQGREDESAQEATRRMTAMLVEWVKTVVFCSPPVKGLDHGTRERLRSLGYVN